MRDAFQAQLRELHEEIANMGALCEEAISTAVKSFVERDADLVGRTSRLEGKIGRKDQEIENLCLRLLMLQTPVASDLRHVSTALHIINDLKRIGDQAEDIAELVPFIQKVLESGVSDLSGLETAIHEMGEAAVKMVSGATEAFLKQDTGLAEQVIAMDDTVDDWFREVKGELIHAMTAPDISEKESETFVNLLMIDKYLERIGDHSVNVAEWVRWSIDGRMFESHE